MSEPCPCGSGRAY
ncbi:MAG: SEC-C domain-containing protein, partial [Spirochaetales bacterium]|nr:SEC-C domain-containing protein [Spirochaetales bacterium]